LAQRFNLPILRLKCEEQLISKLDTDSAVESWNLAQDYGLNILKNMALNVLAENPELVRKVEGKGAVETAGEVVELVVQKSLVFQVPPWMAIQMES